MQFDTGTLWLYLGRMSYYPYAFEAEICRHELGLYTYTVVYLDPDIAQTLPFDTHPRLRMAGEVNDHPIEAAWQPSQGRYILMLSKTLLKAIEMGPGDWVDIRFRIVDQAEVDVPPAVRLAVSAAGLDAQWEALTPGKQRALAYRYEAAKTDKTRKKRLAEMIAWLPDGTDLRQLGKLPVQGGNRPK